LSILALSTSGCVTVRLISNYDEPTDKGLTDIQRASDDFLMAMIANAPSEQNGFEKNKKFYDDMDQQLRRLEFRVGSIPENGHTVKLVKDIRMVILGEGKCTTEGTSLRDLHCIPDNVMKGPSQRSLIDRQQLINQTINSALALELAKKQGTQ
jgi:hypothetical protein